jgi:hypothetical protein
LLLAGCNTISEPVKPPPTSVAFNLAVAPAISADMPLALEQLRAVPLNELNARDIELRTCILERFSSELPSKFNALESGLPLQIAQILKSYRSYWHTGLTHLTSRDVVKQQFQHELDVLVPASEGRQRSLDALEQAVKILVESHGLFALTGQTAPFYELMLWRKQERLEYNVTLPEKNIKVSVYALDDFVSLGWLAYATCNRYSTGGWAEKDALYLVKSKYDLSSENFSISFLVHEAQHFADYAEFPNLSPADLEYRAKLAELALATTTSYELLNKFSSSMRKDRALPHPFADYWLIENLKQALPEHQQQIAQKLWQGIPVHSIQKAAHTLLIQNSASLKSKGAAQVQTVLPD